MGMSFHKTLVIFFGFLLLGNEITAKPKPKKRDDLVILHTEYGSLTLLLYEETPIHKANFLSLSRLGHYDSTVWHRVIKDFMIQGGDITRKKGVDITNREMLPAEIVPRYHHHKGALAAARIGGSFNPDKKSSFCQFYIVQGKIQSADQLTIDQKKLREGISYLFDNPKYDSLVNIIRKFGADQKARMDYSQSLCDFLEHEFDIKIRKEISREAVDLYKAIGGAPHLDGDYTVFGQVVDGLEVIDRLASVKTGKADKPVKDTYVTTEIINMKTKHITKMYGYIYPSKEKNK